MEATPTEHKLPLRYGDFATLSEALDYAAQGETGANFYNGRGQLEAAGTFRETGVPRVSRRGDAR